MTVLVPLNKESRVVRKVIGIGESENIDVAQALCDHLIREHSLCAVPGTCLGVKDFPAIRFGLGRVDFGKSLKIFEDALCSK